MPKSFVIFPPHTIPVLVAVCASLALLQGCAVGPDFQTPPAPAVDQYTQEKLAPDTNSGNGVGGEAQHFVADKDIPGQWWSLYRSEKLNALIESAIAANPSLDAAKASLRQSRETKFAAEGAFFPKVSGSASIEREKVSGAGFGIPGLSSTFSVSSASLNVSYPLDIFGGTRRQVEASAAAEDYQRYQLAAAYLTLTSNVVIAAVNEASLKGQIEATKEIVEIETHLLDVSRQQLALGGIAGSAVFAQQATLAQARASLPPLEKQYAQAHNQLAVLAGRFPSEDIGAQFDLSQLHLPEELPVSLPSKLVIQRPDILAAAATLHQASAEIGVATANMLPQISITGSLGSTASPIGGLLGPGAGVWSLASSLSQPIFQGGTLLHQKRAAVAAYDEAAAQYRSTVLSAFQDVANALRALQSDADALAADVAAEQAAAQSLKLSQDQYKLGGINYTALLDAEQTYQQARVALVQAQANRFSDTAALFQALGGGWWNADAIKTNDADQPGFFDVVKG